MSDNHQWYHDERARQTVEALAELGTVDRRVQAVAVLHWMGGLTVTEIARVRNESIQSVSGDIEIAKSWLSDDLVNRPPPRRDRRSSRPGPGGQLGRPPA